MQHAFLTVDLGFGDTGKGSLVDFLAREYDAHTVVRYNGGAQAGHRVVTGERTPREHVFAQFGSGTLAGAATHLSRFMLLDPLAMVAEERHLRDLGVADAFERTTIDARALVITPFGRAVNRLRELARGAGRHGSCGMGVGETMADYLAHGEQVLFAGDLTDADRLRVKLRFVHAVNMAKAEALRPALADNPAAVAEWALLDDDWQDWLIDAYHDFAARARVVAGETLHSILRRPGTVIFEGAQGVLLDEWRGFHPYTTWSTTTLERADCLLAEAGYAGHTTRIGITRAYATRHGAGPLVSEDAKLAGALPDARNGFGDWQRDFRVGWLDIIMLRYACEVVGRLDWLAVTCLDRLAALPKLQVCRAYQRGTFVIDRIVPAQTARVLAYQEQITRCLARCRPLLKELPDGDALIATLARELGVPVGLISHGPTAGDKQFVGRYARPARVSWYGSSAGSSTSG